MKKRLLAGIAMVAVMAFAVAAPAQNGSIGVYLDAAGTQCDGQTAGSTLDGSIWANLAGTTAGGITGAEFRVDNANSTDYLLVATANPAANVVIGNPFDTQGVNIAFPACQTGPRVQLFTFQVIELSPTPAENDWLTVRQHFTPSNYLFSCPLVTLCDSPAFTKVCLGAPDSDHWRAVINPATGVTGDCQPVAVEEQTWSTVKAFYRSN